MTARDRILGGLAAAALLAGLSSPAPALAGQTSPPVKILSVRVYDAGGSSVAFLELNSTALCGVSAFKIELFKQSGPGMLAVANTAVVTKKNVIVEIPDATGCTGWGTVIKSLAINA